eukprot:CAMPEP_0197435758 /NCGR_PEP_ID=MMETSP1175-20131217/3294_1 /TAXON_ID=1003142 /ORGANISM="Triceratium dubium, Strain CCMP147" /LENGTH=108 /DNA_ID=CAMNT_0042964873 /DNA_START=606 /DNA_END=929 /DNA_ORIENTATION=+
MAILVWQLQTVAINAKMCLGEDVIMGIVQGFGAAICNVENLINNKKYDQRFMDAAALLVESQFFTAEDIRGVRFQFCEAVIEAKAYVPSSNTVIFHWGTFDMPLNEFA